jgi:hypothetical protein
MCNVQCNQAFGYDSDGEGDGCETVFYSVVKSFPGVENSWYLDSEVVNS